MKKISSILWCAAVLAGALPATQAATEPRTAPAVPTPPNLLVGETLSLSNSLPPAPDGERFLFVVDHSASMKKLRPAAHEIVVGMIFRGFEGRMTNGDSYGLWTMSAKPQIGVFPMQVWDGARPLELASLAGRYLRTVPNEGRANFTDLLNVLHSVITAVGDLNVFIITDGETLFNGGPADAELNQQLKTKGKDARRTGKPLIVTVVTREGRVAGVSVTTAGEPIQLPARPPRRVAVTPASAAEAAAEKRAHRSIIITNAPPKPVVTFPAQPAVPAPVVPPVVAAALPSTPPAATPAAEASRESTVAPGTGHQIAARLALPPHAPAMSPVAPVSPEPPATTPAATNGLGSKPEESDQNPPTIEKIPAPEPPVRPVTYRADTQAAPAPVTAIPTTGPTSPHAAAEPSRFAALLEKKMLVFARESGSNQPPAPLPGPAAALPAGSWEVPGLLILGGALLLVALVLLWLILRHQRRTADASLISRSMDRR